VGKNIHIYYTYMCVTIHTYYTYMCVIHVNSRSTICVLIHTHTHTHTPTNTYVWDQFAKIYDVITSNLFFKKSDVKRLKKNQKKNLRSLQGGTLGLALSRCKRKLVSKFAM
jgi:glycerol-3-phosphate O-acyltransferase